MRRNTSTTLLVLAVGLALVLGLAACTAPKGLVGTWTGSMGGQAAGFTWQFTQDGKMTQSGTQMQSVTYTYKLSDDRKTLDLTPEAGASVQAVRYQLNWISDDQFSIAIGGGMGSTPLTFTRQK